MFKVRSLAMAKGFLRSVLNRARYLRFMLRKRGGKLLLLLPTYPVAYNWSKFMTKVICSHGSRRALIYANFAAMRQLLQHFVGPMLQNVFEGSSMFHWNFCWPKIMLKLVMLKLLTVRSTGAKLLSTNETWILQRFW